MRYTDKERWQEARKECAERGHIPTTVMAGSEMDVYYQYWPSVVDLVEDEFRNEANKEQWLRYEKGRRGRDWFGIDGGLEAVNRAVTYGWEEGLHKVRETLNKVQVPKFKNIRRRKMRGDYGDDLDMQAVYSGNLNTAWTRTRRKISPSRSPRKVTILCDSSLSGAIRPDQIFWTGAVALRLNDALQESGRSVQIISSDTTRMDGYVLSSNVVIKDYRQPLEPEVVAATLCLAGWMRGPIFRATALFEQRINAGWGMPVANFIAKDHRDSSDSVFLFSNILSREAAVQAIEQAVKVIGVEA